MKINIGAVCAGAAAALMLLLSAPAAWAQGGAVAARITAQVDDTRTVQLQGNVHPLARPEFDRGAVADSQSMTRMLLLLQRSPGQEAALQQVIDAQQTKSSGSYHAWLTPAQFGTQFGPADADVQTISDWLTAKGFQVANVAAGRNVIEFSGNAGQVRTAFHTEIHNFEVNGRNYFANVSDPAIPEALAPVVKGVVALQNFPKTSHRRLSGEYQRDKATGTLRPLFTYGNPANFAVGPADFAKLYNIPSTATGAGQSIAVIGQSNINPEDVTSFRHMFGIDQNFPANNVTVIVNGPDPGIVGPNAINCSDTSSDDEGESDVDVEWAGAIAPAANIYLVTSLTTCTNPTQITAGIDLSALYAVDNNVAPIISESYGLCEGFNGSAGNQFYYNLWEQAAAEGITVVISTGDSGSAGCDSSSNENAATLGVAVSGTASTPFNVAAGGTDFNPKTLPPSGSTGNQYWAGPSGNLAGSQSILQYIPETPWDGSACATNFPSPCSSVDSNGSDLSGGSGGPSSCVNSTVNSSGTGFSCSTSSTSTTTAGGWIMPSYQMGAVGPTASNLGFTTRTQPDISFFSSNGSNTVALIICQTDALTSGATSCDLNSPFTDFLLAGGTSFAAPAFAGVMALVNQSQATAQNPTPRQGNANYVLYPLAASDTNYTGGNCNTATSQSAPNAPNSACIFNDVAVSANTNGVEWNNSVACVGGSPNCSANSSTPFGILVSNSNPAFVSGSGYNLATGIGTINVGNLLTKWGTVLRAATMTTLSNPTTTSPVSGGPFTVTISVTGGATTPSGNVSLTALDASGNVLCQDANVTANVCSFGPFTLSSGTVTATTTLIPPGASSVTATYGGDATHAVSTGNLPFTMPGSTGANQTGTTTLYWAGLQSNGTWLTTTSSQKFTYGVPLGYFLSIVVTGNSGKSCGFNYPNTTPSTAIPCPTGTITLTDNGNALNDFPKGAQNNATNVAKLNNQGMVEDQPINLNVGSHSIVATYSGDANYSAGSPSNTLSVTLTQASTQTVVASSLGTVTSGSQVVLTATVGTNSNGDAPCGTSDGGTVSFTAGGTAVSGTPTYTAIAPTATAGASCTATLSTTVSALLPPVARNTRPTLPLWPMLVAALSLVLFALGWRWIPQNRRRAYAYAGMLAFALVVVGVAGCGGGGGSSAPPGTTSVSVTASYAGNVNYTSSTSPSITILVTQ